MQQITYITNITYLLLSHFALLCFTGTVFVRNCLCDPAINRSVDAICPAVCAHFVSRCHMQATSQYFKVSSYYYKYWGDLGSSDL